jgi:hypothetical protein
MVRGHCPETIQAQTRAMFARVLSAWTLDLLKLRRTGLIVPSAREGAPDPAMPFPREEKCLSLTEAHWPARPAAALPRWKPQRRAA